MRRVGAHRRRRSTELPTAASVGARWERSECALRVSVRTPPSLQGEPSGRRHDVEAQRPGLERGAAASGPRTRRCGAEPGGSPAEQRAWSRRRLEPSAEQGSPPPRRSDSRRPPAGRQPLQYVARRDDCELARWCERSAVARERFRKRGTSTAVDATPLRPSTTPCAAMRERLPSSWDAFVATKECLARGGDGFDRRRRSIVVLRNGTVTTETKRPSATSRLVASDGSIARSASHFVAAKGTPVTRSARWRTTEHRLVQAPREGRVLPEGLA
jgi:hypothetical protein